VIDGRCAAAGAAGQRAVEQPRVGRDARADALLQARRVVQAIHADVRPVRLSSQKKPGMSSLSP